MPLPKRLRVCSAALAVAAVIGSTAHGGPEDATTPGVTIEMLDAMARLPGEIGSLPDVPVPPDNPQAPAKVDLGRRLFFETMLSRDGKQSCASCHDPRKGFADGRALGVGFEGRTLGRHSPSVLNAAFNKLQFWDGRAASLEEQAAGPIMAAAEMNMPSEQELVRRLSESARYRSAFLTVFGGAPSLQTVSRAIAAFERTLVTPDAPFDRYAAGDKHALTDQQKRGLLLFIGKASCTQCHRGPNFSDDEFHRIGLVGSTDDVGRFAVTKREQDRGAFKTPSLRNVALTAPYMHDGSVASLEAIVDFYDRGGDAAGGRSDKVLPLELTTTEKSDLVAFLASLTGRLPEGAGR